MNEDTNSSRAEEIHKICHAFVSEDCPAAIYAMFYQGFWGTKSEKSRNLAKSLK